LCEIEVGFSSDKDRWDMVKAVLLLKGQLRSSRFAINGSSELTRKFEMYENELVSDES
jgi:hypothetical protein